MRGRPLFNIDEWNMYDAVNNDLPRTNKAVEGWHNSYTSILEMTNPTIWKCIEAIRKEESLTRLKIELLIAGKEPP